MYLACVSSLVQAVQLNEEISEALTAGIQATLVHTRTVPIVACAAAGHEGLEEDQDDLELELEAILNSSSKGTSTDCQGAGWVRNWSIVVTEH